MTDISFETEKNEWKYQKAFLKLIVSRPLINVFTIEFVEFKEPSTNTVNFLIDSFRSFGGFLTQK